MYAVSFIYLNLSKQCFPFPPIQGNFFSLQRKWAFSTVTTVDDCIFHRTYQFPYHPQVWPLVHISVTIGNSIPSLRILTIWWVTCWKRSMRRPPRMRMQNGPPSVIDRSSPGGGSRGGLFHKCSDIYAPHPKTAPYQGMLNRYFPWQETPRRCRVCTCPSDPQLGGGGWGVLTWTRTLQHRDSNTKQKKNLYTTCRTSLMHPAPNKEG